MKILVDGKELTGKTSCVITIEHTNPDGTAETNEAGETIKDTINVHNFAGNIAVEIN